MKRLGRQERCRRGENVGQGLQGLGDGAIISCVDNGTIAESDEVHTSGGRTAIGFGEIGKASPAQGNTWQEPAQDGQSVGWSRTLRPWPLGLIAFQVRLRYTTSVR